MRRMAATPVQVRVLATTPADMRTTRQTAFGRREHPRELTLEVRDPTGATRTVERRMWVPEWVGVEQLVSSGRVLDATADGDDVAIDWAQIEEDVTAEVLARLHDGPVEQRVAQIDELHAAGQFKDELHARARRRLVETGDLRAPEGGNAKYWVLAAVLVLAGLTGIAIAWIDPVTVGERNCGHNRTLTECDEADDVMATIVPLVVGGLTLLVGLLVLLAAAKPRGGVISLRPWRRWNAR